MRKLLLVVMALVVISITQFVDESIPCLRLGSQCEETKSPFKDDGNFTPYDSGPEILLDEEPALPGPFPEDDNDVACYNYINGKT